MRLDLSQQMKMDQRMVLAPRMIQSMEILQLPLLALQERIQQEMLSNPVLEIDEPNAELPDPGAQSDIHQSNPDTSEAMLAYIIILQPLMPYNIEMEVNGFTSHFYQMITIICMAMSSIDIYTPSDLPVWNHGPARIFSQFFEFQKQDSINQIPRSWMVRVVKFFWFKIFYVLPVDH